ncbi:MAG: Asp-tRNA(Asn)/Glu-tRNA(Gln) amidotransferase subunit GatA [Firmicutes bacterium]|nr:Asp-tRNA(Asn)/Glu-tRNA(Gln) amidotransferase subunit GatA [Bacillota bacterium]
MAQNVQAGKLSAEDVVRAAYRRIDHVEPSVHAFLHLNREQALAEARAIDRLSAEERRHLPLAGVPVAVKDNMVTRDFPTTAASKILGEFLSPYDATVVARLRAAGAIIVGKTNLDEFAMGSSTEHSAFQKTCNPWDITRVPGGSSGGSAASVAAQMVPVALGSDTGGSIRQPSSYCGVMGLKPTYGRVSRYGLIAFASSLDQIGPIARHVEDLSLVLQVIGGYDPADATSINQPAPDVSGIAGNLHGVRIGVPVEYFGEGIDPAIRQKIEAALAFAKDHGASVQEISLPHTQYAIATYYLVATAEASSNLSRFDGVRYGLRETGKDLLEMYEKTRASGFGSEVKRRILLGTYALSAGYYDAYYLKALKVRTLIRQDFEKAFEQVDMIVTPTTPELPFRFGEKSADPLQMYLSDIFTVTLNLAGLPGASVPVGLVGGLPVGMQWIAPALKERELLSALAGFSREWPALDYPQSIGEEE